MTKPLDLPASLSVFAWSTPKGQGAPVGSPWTRDNWLPFVGPTGFLLAQTLANDIVKASATSRKPLEVDTAELCWRLGVGPKVAARAIGRLGWNELAKWSGRAGVSPLEVKMFWPRLPNHLEKQLLRL